MDNYKPFEKGINSVLHAKWNMKLITPLAIRNGSNSAWQTQPEIVKKGRNQGMQYSWKNTKKLLNKDNNNKSKSGWSELADFNYQFCVNNGNVDVEYSIPASSIRGAIRQWTVKDLINRDDWKTFFVHKKGTLTEEKMEEMIKNARDSLKDQNKRWADILSLFGIAYDLNPKISDPIAWSGRMKIETELPPINDTRLDVQGEWKNNAGMVDGPKNINRQITVRNPLDRMTHGAKEGGLHQFVEMSPGEEFFIKFQIENPIQADVEMIKLWVQDINDGYLRFGALASQGRGRMKIETENYKFYFNSTHKIEPSRVAGQEDIAKGSLLEGFWKGYNCSIDKLFFILKNRKLKLENKNES